MDEIRPQAPPRRWFRFGLRTLFLLLTAVSLWLGWQANWVATRSKIRADVLARGGMIDQYAPHLRSGADYHTASGDRKDRFPRLWGIMGAKPIRQIMIPIGEFSDAERLRIKAAFPEIGNGLGFKFDPDEEP